MVKSLIFNAAVSAAATVAPNFEAMGTIEAKFEAYNVWQNKMYTNKTEMTKRFDAFAKNDMIIKDSNAQNKSYTLGHNMFSDLSLDEFTAIYIGGLSQNPTLNRQKNYDYSLSKRVAGNESAIDWVQKGGVTPVKDQGMCGSCWAFSTTGAMEGALFAATGKLVSLSEQELVSCDNTAMGCGGGLMDNAFDYISQNGICAEKDYPYTSDQGVEGTCIQKCASQATAKGYKDVPKEDEDALYTALQSSTVSVVVEADKSAFHLYKSGVLDDASCGVKFNHGVLLVGYGTDTASGKEYWKVKNSWSTMWGEEGYIRMVKGKNQCGISELASQPVGVAAPAPTPPTPAPPPTPQAPPHYGDPADGCLSDEVAIKYKIFDGDFCSPKCANKTYVCPTNKPAGVTASPRCIVPDPAGYLRCGLLCAPSLAALKLDQKAADAMCGKATCKPVGDAGLCMYND